MSTFRPVAVVTGASSGIGAELARIFAEGGHEVVLVARGEAQMAKVADAIALAGYPRPHVLSIDLSRLDGGARLGHELASRGLEPAYIINNAGFGLMGEATELDRGEQLAMVDLNVRTLIDLSLRFTASLAAHRGGILNVASVAGFLPAPGMAVYYASKACVVSFSEALHWELANKGVRVTTLCPGPVPTGFQKRAGSKPRASARFFVLSAEDVARAGYAGLMRGRRLVVPGFGNKAIIALTRILPRAAMLWLADARSLRGPRPRWGQRQ